MPKTETETPAPEDPVAAAWQSVKVLLGIVIEMFGPPTELLALTLVPRRWRRDMLIWLRPAEALVRRLLLIRAAEIADTLKAPPTPRRRARFEALLRLPRATPPGDSTAWRGVRLVLIRLRRPRTPRARSTRSFLPRSEPFKAAPTTQEMYAEKPSRKPPVPVYVHVAAQPSPAEGPPPLSRPPTPFTGIALAERLEALIRAVHRPEPLARRLARRLMFHPQATTLMVRPLPDDASNPARVALRELEAPLVRAVDLFHRRFSSA